MVWAVQKVCLACAPRFLPVRGRDRQHVMGVLSRRAG